MGARALPRAEGRGAGRACGLADARSGRACFCAQHDRFALPLQQLALTVAPKGPGGSDRRYGMLRARNAKTVWEHHFLYLIVVR